MTDDYDAATYGERIAEKYDEWYSTHDEDVVDRIFEMSNKGSVLELGIGTGRIAIPLAQRGIDVAGVDSSRSMVQKLKSKKGGRKIPVKIEDFSSFTISEKFDVVFVIFNTIFALQSQDEQISCFKCVHKTLKDKGKFVIEAFVPDLSRFDRGQTVRAVDVGIDQIKLECSKHDSADQTITSQTVHISEDGIKLYPLKIRYAWPAEIDLMGRLAGFQLLERWGNWKKENFHSSSGFHISVYQKK